ncbi:MAG: L-serine ammonia-lyase, iron-sulfur-dependent, subunit alpha [Treponema sp.]|nr:L-serine ammonia-lyase, iron-sulfur-dependent, subunit alpha [Treponema sp.]
MIRWSTMDRDDFFTTLLKRELVTAMGCTEPAAVALAAASARKALGEVPEKVLVRASRDIIKNAMHAGIPNCSLKGIHAAAALGLAGGDSEAGLNILAGLDAGAEAEAQSYLDRGLIEVELAEDVPPIFIEIWLEGGGKQRGARILNEHQAVEILGDMGPGIGRTSGRVSTGLPEADLAGEFSLAELCAYTDSVPLPAISWLTGAAKTNMALACHSVENGYGIQVGKTMSGDIGDREDLFRRGAVLAAAASDARMAGCAMPVVINSGSGNQGITVSVPVLVLAEGLGKGEEEIARALCLAHLAALMMTARKDRLSALCGAFTAAVGTAAGYVRLLGGGYDDLDRCVNNMVGNLMGILCDGAKGSCALKIYTCVEAAALGAKIALAGHRAPPLEGVLGGNLDETLALVRKISHEGMIPLDKTVLGILLQKGPASPAHR